MRGFLLCFVLFLPCFVFQLTRPFVVEILTSPSPEKPTRNVLDGLVLKKTRAQRDLQMRVASVTDRSIKITRVGERHSCSRVSFPRQRLGAADFCLRKIPVNSRNPSRDVCPPEGSLQASPDSSAPSTPSGSGRLPPPPHPRSAWARGQRLQRRRRQNLTPGLSPWKLQVKSRLGLGAALSSVTIWRD